MQSHLVALFKLSSAQGASRLIRKKTYLKVFTAALKFHDLQSVKGVSEMIDAALIDLMGASSRYFMIVRTLSISTQQPDQATGYWRIAAEQAAAAAEKAELQDCQLQRQPLLQKGWRECWR